MFPARLLPFPGAVPELPSFANALPPGRLAELSGAAGSARTSLALAAVREAQCAGEPAAWIQTAGGFLYPPDVAECGVDPGALVVVQVPGAAGPAAAFRAAEILLRSGGFGLVVVDLRRTPRAASGAMQSRLAALTREHAARGLLLTDRASSVPSLGPLVSLRVEPRRERLGGGRFAIEPAVLKSKQGGALELASERRRGPWSPR
jgi:recombination protein RecA